MFFDFFSAALKTNGPELIDLKCLWTVNTFWVNKKNFSFEMQMEKNPPMAATISFNSVSDFKVDETEIQKKTYLKLSLKVKGTKIKQQQQLSTQRYSYTFISCT